MPQDGGGKEMEEMELVEEEPSNPATRGDDRQAAGGADGTNCESHFCLITATVTNNTTDEQYLLVMCVQATREEIRSKAWRLKNLRSVLDKYGIVKTLNGTTISMTFQHEKFLTDALQSRKWGRPEIEKEFVLTITLSEPIQTMQDITPQAAEALQVLHGGAHVGLRGQFFEEESEQPTRLVFKKADGTTEEQPTTALVSPPYDYSLDTIVIIHSSSLPFRHVEMQIETSGKRLYDSLDSIVLGANWFWLMNSDDFRIGFVPVDLELVPANDLQEGDENKVNEESAKPLHELFAKVLRMLADSMSRQTHLKLSAAQFLLRTFKSKFRNFWDIIQYVAIAETLTHFDGNFLVHVPKAVAIMQKITMLLRVGANNRVISFAAVEHNSNKPPEVSQINGLHLSSHKNWVLTRQPPSTGPSLLHSTIDAIISVESRTLFPRQTMTRELRPGRFYMIVLKTKMKQHELPSLVFTSTLYEDSVDAQTEKKDGNKTEKDAEEDDRKDAKKDNGSKTGKRKRQQKKMNVNVTDRGMGLFQTPINVDSSTHKEALLKAIAAIVEGMTANMGIEHSLAPAVPVTFEECEPNSLRALLGLFDIKLDQKLNNNMSADMAMLMEKILKKTVLFIYDVHGTFSEINLEYPPDLSETSEKTTTPSTENDPTDPNYVSSSDEEDDVGDGKVTEKLLTENDLFDPSVYQRTRQSGVRFGSTVNLEPVSMGDMSSFFRRLLPVLASDAFEVVNAKLEKTTVTMRIGVKSLKKFKKEVLNALKGNSFVPEKFFNLVEEFFDECIEMSQMISKHSSMTTCAAPGIYNARYVFELTKAEIQRMVAWFETVLAHGKYQTFERRQSSDACAKILSLNPSREEESRRAYRKLFQPMVIEPTPKEQYENGVERFFKILIRKMKAFKKAIDSQYQTDVTANDKLLNWNAAELVALMMKTLDPKKLEQATLTALNMTLPSITCRNGRKTSDVKERPVKPAARNTTNMTWLKELQKQMNQLVKDATPERPWIKESCAEEPLFKTKLLEPNVLEELLKIFLLVHNLWKAQVEVDEAPGTQTLIEKLQQLQTEAVNCLSSSINPSLDSAGDGGLSSFLPAKSLLAEALSRVDNNGNPNCDSENTHLLVAMIQRPESVPIEKSYERCDNNTHQSRGPQLKVFDKEQADLHCLLQLANALKIVLCKQGGIRELIGKILKILSTQFMIKKWREVINGHCYERMHKARMHILSENSKIFEHWTNTLLRCPVYQTHKARKELSARYAKESKMDCDLLVHLDLIIVSVLMVTTSRAWQILTQEFSLQQLDLPDVLGTVHDAMQAKYQPYRDDDTSGSSDENMSSDDEGDDSQEDDEDADESEKVKADEPKKKPRLSNVP